MKLSRLFASLVILASPLFLQAQTTATEMTPPANTTLTDEQIAEVIQAANAAEIEAAQYAKTHAGKGEVKKFAEHMISAHNDNSKKLSALQTKNQMKPATNSEAQKVTSDAQSMMSDLRNKKKTEFEKAYMQSQVKMHQQLLNDLDQKFIPQARNTEFKNFLQETREHVKEHLSKAESMESTTK